MNETRKTGVENDSAIDEAALFDTALNSSDQLLRESLRADERRRRARRILFFTLSVGGIVMGTVILAFVAGWLTLAAPPPAKGKPSDDTRIERAEDLARAGWEQWQKHDYDAAAKKFEQSVALDAESANAWNGLGWARFNGGNGEGAVEAFEKCVALEPEHPAGLNGLGQVYLSWRDYDNARKYLTKAAPSASAAWYGLGRLYLLTGKYDEAQKWIKKALKDQPEDASLKQMLAAAEKGDLPDELRRQIEPAGKPDGSPAAKLAAEGWRQFNQGKTRSAETAFRRALAKDPESLSALNGLGFLMLNNGKTAGAKHYFEKCLQQDPDAAGPMNGLARCLKEEGKEKEAVELWEKMYKKYPGPNAAAYGLATTYSERKEYAKALPYYEQLAKAEPDNAELKKGLDEARQGAAKK